MSIARTLFPLACVLMFAACTPPTNSGAPPADSASTSATSPLASNCDTPAVPLALGASVSGNIPQAAGYPENARYYCINVGAGVPSVTIELSGMDVDLDLYVGSGNIASVQGVDLQAGETYEWKSNAFGTGAETVTIPTPAPGVYYAEIVSFEGQASNYTLTTR
jgi:hypothetical protein